MANTIAEITAFFFLSLLIALAYVLTVDMYYTGIWITWNEVVGAVKSFLGIYFLNNSQSNITHGLSITVQCCQLMAFPVLWFRDHLSF